MPPLLTPQLTFLGLTPAGWCPPRAWSSRAGRAALCVQASSCGSALQALPRRTGLRPPSCMPCPGWGGWTESLRPPPGLSLAREQLPAGPGMWVSFPAPLHTLFSPPFLYGGGHAWHWELRPCAFPMGPESQGAPAERGRGSSAGLSPSPFLGPDGHFSVPLATCVPHAQKGAAVRSLATWAPGFRAIPSPGLGRPCPPPSNSIHLPLSHFTCPRA